MALRKCPKCELNYIKGDAPFCDVCTRAIKRVQKSSEQHDEEPDEPILCYECGEAPALPGKELCIECLKERKRQAQLEAAVELPDSELDDLPEEALSEDEEEDL